MIHYIIICNILGNKICTIYLTDIYQWEVCVCVCVPLVVRRDFKEGTIQYR